MRLLVLQPTRFLGNAVISLKTIAALTRAHDVDLIIDDRHASLIHVALGSRCRVITYPRAKIKSRSVLGQLQTFYRLVRRVRANRYDIIVDLDGTSLSGTIVALTRGRHRIGPGFVKRRRFYHQAVAMDQATQHCFDDFARVAETVNGEPVPRQYLMLPELPHPELPPSLRSINNGQKPLACLHPSASKSYKEWPATQFASLSDALHERGYQVIILGAGEGERQTIDAIGEHTR
ncbi:MAG: glycosyltransferase family 9 protein, partial [Pseudomonadota bacterium]